MRSDTLAALRRARAEGRAVVLATWLPSAAHPAERQRLFGVEEAPAELREAAAKALRSDLAEVVAASDGEVLIEPHNPPLRLVLVGAVHIAHPLAAMARLAGFAVTLVDPRRAFAT